MKLLSAREKGTGMALDELQRWFLSQVSGDAGLAVPAIPVEQVILPSKSMSAPERLAVYTEMYFLRLHEALVDDYPAVGALLGDELFEDLVRDYIAEHPPNSFTLAHAGRMLPAFLDAHPRFGAAGVSDLARLELAIAESFDALSTAVLRPEDLSGLSPDAWPLARFHMAGGFFLLSSRADVNQVLDDVSEGVEPIAAPVPQPSWTLVWRKAFVVWRKKISQPMYRTLEVLAAGGSISDAVEAALESWEGDEAELGEQIFQWFGEWLSEGLFSAVVLPAGEEARRQP